MMKINLGTEGFISLTCSNRSPLLRQGKARTQGRNLAVGTEATMKKHCLLACSSGLTQPVSLYNINPLPPSDSSHTGLGISTSSIHQENPPTHRLAHGAVRQNHFLNLDSLFPNESNLYQIDKKQNCTGGSALLVFLPPVMFKQDILHVEPYSALILEFLVLWFPACMS